MPTVHACAFRNTRPRSCVYSIWRGWSYDELPFHVERSSFHGLRDARCLYKGAHIMYIHVEDKSC